MPDGNESEGGEAPKGFGDHLHEVGESAEATFGLPKALGEMVPEFMAKHRLKVAEDALEAHTPRADRAWENGESGDLFSTTQDNHGVLVDNAEAAEKQLALTEASTPDALLEKTAHAHLKLKAAQASMPKTPTNPAEAAGSDKAIEESFKDITKSSVGLDEAKAAYKSSTGFLGNPGVSAALGGLGIYGGLSKLGDAGHDLHEGHYADAGVDGISGALGLASGGSELAGAANASIALDGSLLGVETGSSLAGGLGSLGSWAGPLGIAAAVAGLDAAGNDRVKEMGWFQDGKGKNISTYEQATQDVGGSFRCVDTLLGDSTAAKVGMAVPALLAAGGDAIAEYAGGTVLNVGEGVEGLAGSSGMFGTAKNAGGEGVHNRGAFEALDDTGKYLGNLVGGGWLGGGVRAATDVLGALPALGAEAQGVAVGGANALVHTVGGLAADSGAFGKNADGSNREAFGALDAAGKYLGNGLDSALGFDQSSTAGKIVGGGVEVATDAVGALGALAADGVGAVAGGAKDLWEWL